MYYHASFNLGVFLHSTIINLHTCVKIIFCYLLLYSLLHSFLWPKFVGFFHQIFIYWNLKYRRGQKYCIANSNLLSSFSYPPNLLNPCYLLLFSYECGFFFIALVKKTVLSWYNAIKMKIEIPIISGSEKIGGIS